MLVLLFALAGAAQSSQVQPSQKDDPIVCTRVKVGDEVGTHLVTKKKVCMHKSDRDFIEKQQAATVKDIINDGNDRMRFIPQPR